MTFATPLLLFAVLVPAALFVWVWKRERRRTVLPFDHGRQTAGSRWRFVINMAECVPPLVLAVLIVILAGPQRLGKPKTKRILTNIEFCVDISGSMMADFGEGTRYDASMKAINEFLDYREGDAFGLTFFGTEVLHWCPLTSDPSALRCSTPFMKPNVAPPWFNGTSIGKALLACREVLKSREEGDRMILLVSDGSSSDLFGGNDVEVAKKLKEDNVVVYAIHIADGNIPDAIVNITSMTSGEVFNPGDPDALKHVFGRIDKMQETRLEKASAETMDNFFPYCMVALSLLGLQLLTLLGLRYTPW
ncbi:MAG: VWA domain-containing protein [Planctomycetota bacterium]